jgi:hypothetical protein
MSVTVSEILMAWDGMFGDTLSVFAGLAFAIVMIDSVVVWFSRVRS